MGAEAANASDVLNWVYNWSEGSCDIDVTPVTDDDTTREVILKKEPEWKADYYRSMPYAGSMGNRLLRTSPKKPTLAIPALALHLVDGTTLVGALDWSLLPRSLRRISTCGRTTGPRCARSSGTLS